MSSDCEALVGTIALGEYSLTRLVREDDSLAVFASKSTVEGAQYTVIVAKNVSVDTSATALEVAVERMARHSVGLKGLLPILHARPVALPSGKAALGLVRRGEPGLSLTDEISRGPHSADETARWLRPIATTLAALHDQGIAHGCLSATAVIMRNDEIFLDLFGITAAGESAAGSRGARDTIPTTYRPPELTGAFPPAPGPWSDAYALAVLAVELLSGKPATPTPPGPTPTGAPSPRSLGVAVSNRVEERFLRALSTNPATRPLDVVDFIRQLETMDLSEDPPNAPAKPQPTPAKAPAIVAPAPKAPSSTATPVPAARSSGPHAQPSGPIALKSSNIKPPVVAPESALESPKLLWITAGLGLTLMLGAVIVAVVFLVDPGTMPTPTSPPATTATTPLTTPGPTPTPVPTPTPTATGTTTEEPVGPVGSLADQPNTGPAVFPADEHALLPIAYDSATRGARDASLTLVIFGDLTCPHTARLLHTIPPLEKKYGKELRVVFKFFPLPGRSGARDAAEAAATVLAKGGNAAIWKFIDATSKSPENLDAGRLEEIGIKSGVPAGAVTQGITQHSHAALVDRDIAIGRRFGVRSTPSVFFNGKRLDGFHTPEIFANFLDEELARVNKLSREGVPRDRMYATRVQTNVTTSEGDIKIK